MNNTRLFNLILIFTALLFTHSAAQGQLTLLRPTYGGWINDYFGSGVAIDGDNAAVAAFPNQQNINLHSDYNYITFYHLENGQWSQTSTLKYDYHVKNHAIDFSPDGKFWTGVNLSAGVGSSDNIHNPTSFVPFYLLPDGTTVNYKQLATTLSTSSTHIAFNASPAYSSKFNQTVYLLNRDDGSLTKKIQLDDTEEDQGFGVKLLLTDDFLFVTGINSKNGGVKTGAVFIYAKQKNWALDTILYSTDLLASFFGNSLAATGNYLVVGAPAGHFVKGKAFLFKHENGHWTQKYATTCPINSSIGDQFGFSMTNKEEKVFIGAPFNSKYGKKAGLVLEFKIQGDSLAWEGEIHPANPLIKTGFGYQLDIDEKLIVSAIYDNKMGQAYIFHFDQDHWTEENILPTGQIFANNPGNRLQSNDSILVTDFRWSDALAAYHLDDNQQWTQDVAIYERNLEDNKDFGELYALYGNEIATIADDHCKVYQRNSATKEWERTANIALEDHYTKYVAMGKNRILIGYDDRILDFERTNGVWTKTTTIQYPVIPNATQDYKFKEFWLDGDWLYLQNTAAQTGINSVKSGAIEILKTEGGVWGYAGKIEPEDGHTNDYFGASIAQTGQQLAIASTGHFPSGAVYIFRKENGSWKQKSKLVDPNLNYGDGFGASLVFRDSLTLAVGVPYAPNQQSKGVVEVFRLNANQVWQKMQDIKPNNPFYESEPYTYFGRSLAGNQNHLMIGAPYLSFQDQQSEGAIFLYDYAQLPVKTNTIFESNLPVVFPNPTSGKIFFKEIPLDSKWQLINSLGQITASGIIHGETLDLSPHPDGLYYFIVQTPSGKNLRKKIILTK